MARAHVLGAGIVGVGTIAAVVAWAAAPPRAGTSLPPAGADSANAATLLAQARGTRPAICELAVQAVDSRYGSWRRMAYAPDADPAATALATWAANRIEGADAIPVLRDGLSDTDPCVRRIAARLLGRVRDPAAVTVLVDALQSGHDETRRMAAIGLGYAEEHGAVASLIETLAAAAAPVRAASAWALGEIEEEAAVPALARALGQDPDPAVRVQAAVALGAMW
ncbi:MAG: HEAT repeat domain-containing protein [Gemmatimonadales bacterium]|jgi:hypothetical protein